MPRTRRSLVRHRQTDVCVISVSVISGERLNETNRQVDHQVGAVKQRDPTTQPVICRCCPRIIAARCQRRRSVASSSCPSSADESYQSWHHV